MNSHTDAFGKALQCSDWHSVAAMLSDSAQLDFLPIKVSIHIVRYVQEVVAKYLLVCQPLDHTDSGCRLWLLQSLYICSYRDTIAAVY
jgi:hypothetical protein